MKETFADYALAGAALVTGVGVAVALYFLLCIAWIEVTHWFSVRKCKRCGNRRGNVKGYQRAYGITVCECKKCGQNWAG